MIEQILDTAEELFSKHGLHGVTLKDVAQARRGPPHAAQLLLRGQEETVRRRVRAAGSRHELAADEGARRVRRGDQGKPSVEGALRAFLDTDLDLYIKGGERWKNYGALGAQVANTPEWGAELMDAHFDPVVLRLIGLLKKALPRLCGRGHLLGLSLRDRRAAPHARAHRTNRQAVRWDCKSEDFEAVKKRMATFMAGGFMAVCRQR